MSFGLRSDFHTISLQLVIIILIIIYISNTWYYFTRVYISYMESSMYLLKNERTPRKLQKRGKRIKMQSTKESFYSVQI